MAFLKKILKIHSILTIFMLSSVLGQTTIETTTLDDWSYFWTTTEIFDTSETTTGSTTEISEMPTGSTTSFYSDPTTTILPETTEHLELENRLLDEPTPESVTNAPNSTESTTRFPTTTKQTTTTQLPPTPIDFKCPKYGRYPVPESQCQKYYFCDYAKKVFVYHCYKGQLFNPVHQSCESKFVCPAT